MLKKLRRNSKQVLELRRTSSATPESFKPTPPIQETAKTQILTFFDLPAELRNVVYEYVAAETKLHIVAPMSKSTKKPPPLPSLLLVSRQTRQEYVPLLLANASITAVIKDYDFRNLMRVCCSLYSTELKALRSNNNLIVRFLAQKGKPECMPSLRRWLVNRGKGLDRIPWQYGLCWKYPHQLVPTSGPVRRLNTYVEQRKILEQNLEALAQLHKTIEPLLRFELEPVIRAFEREARDLIPDDPEDGNVTSEMDMMTMYWRGSPSR